MRKTQAGIVSLMLTQTRSLEVIVLRKRGSARRPRQRAPHQQPDGDIDRNGIESRQKACPRNTSCRRPWPLQPARIDPPHQARHQRSDTQASHDHPRRHWRLRARMHAAPTSPSCRGVTWAMEDTTMAMVTACRLARLLDSGAHRGRQVIARLERSAHALRGEIDKGAKFWQ